MSLVDHGVIVDLKPIGGGWRFAQMLDGKPMFIPANFDPVKKTNAAPNARALVEMVRTFRVNQGIEMGEVEQEVADYIKAVSPQNDRFRTTKGVGMPRLTPIRPLAQDLREWLEAVKPEKPMLLTQGEAAERAMVCAKCPQNIKWQTACGECNDEVIYAGAMLRNLPSYPLDDMLRGCRLHRIYLPAAVFVDRDNLPPRHSEAPPACWVPSKSNP